MTTQAPTQPQPHSEDEEGGVGFLARGDASRYVCACVCEYFIHVYIQ